MDTSARRFRLQLHYDGSAFEGWQVQARGRTVQGELERVLGQLFSAPVRATAAGRTDAGVHATGQVVGVDVPARWTPAALRRSLNALLPADVWVASAAETNPHFHARFDAVARAYRYRIGIAEHTASPFHRRWCWPAAGALDVPRMSAATTALIGAHSFRTFAKAGQEERGDRCVIASAEWLPWDDLGLEFRIRADRFLHHMVRYLVGTLVAIGRGQRPESDLAAMLDLPPELPIPRSLQTSPPAPPGGLYLSHVHYPGDPP